MYRELGVISIAIIWLGLIFLIVKWPGNRAMTFSQHAAQSRAALIYYFFLFVFTLPLFYLFMTRWFVPRFHFADMFMWFYTAGISMQLVAVTVPETKGLKVFIHRNSAFLMSLLLMPLLTMILVNSNVDITARLITCTALVVQITIAAATIPKNGYHKDVLVLQATYIAVFHVSILAAVYL